MVPKPKTSEYNYSSLGIKPIPSRETVFRNVDQWLDDKRVHDGAEGLWRVYDDLYDLSEYIDRHPGGRLWLEVTKGVDITEAFESHHISTKPEEILKKFYVRKAVTPRNSPYTFAENGFYKTLKRNVRESLKTLPKNLHLRSHIATDLLLIASFIFSILACSHWNFWLGLASGIFLAATAVAAHNYYHQRDNFRMYYSDICRGPSREFRIGHILSHHMYTNTIADTQAYDDEPFLQYFPHEKSFLAKYGSWLYGPLLLWTFNVHYLIVVRLANRFMNGQIGKIDLLPMLLPASMYIFGGQTLMATAGMWFFVLSISSFWFNFIGNSTTHFHPDIFMDGDQPRSPEEMDWGIAQLDTVSDRMEITGVHLLVLTMFGDHAMHHLFPAFDHALHKYLYPVVQETMKQFNLDFRMTTQIDMWQGYFRQLAKDKPNSNPPDLFIYKNRKNTML